MPINLSGLASGLDTEAIVSQLMALEQNKVTAVQRRQIGVQQHKDDLAAIKTKLDAFKSAAAALSDTATWKPTQTTTSSDPTKIDVSLLGGAGIGGHSIQVHKLASSAQHGFTYAPSGTAGSLTLHYGTGPGSDTAPDNSKVTIAIAANATAADVATAINANEGSPVYAAVIKENDGTERVILSARKTGENSNFTVDTSAMGAGSSLTEVPAYERVGDVALNASYTIDGEASPRESETNIVENAIPGVRLTLKGVTNGSESITTTAAAIDKDGGVQEGQGAGRRLQRGRHLGPRRADREERSEGDDDRRPAEGQAVRRHGPDLDAVPAQGTDDAGRQRPRPHGPRRPGHRHPEVHRRRPRPKTRRPASSTSTPRSSRRRSTPTGPRSAICSRARVPRRASRA